MMWWTFANISHFHCCLGSTALILNGLHLSSDMSQYFVDNMAMERSFQKKEVQIRKKKYWVEMRMSNNAE